MIAPVEVSYPHWPAGKTAWRCPHCGLLRPTLDGALACCAEQDLYEAGVRQACWPVSSDPTVTRRALSKLRRERGVKPWKA